MSTQQDTKQVLAASNIITEIVLAFSWGALAGGLIMLLAVACSANATATNNRQNTFGAVIESKNTNTYLFAVPIAGQIIEHDEEVVTNVRFQPYGTPALYDETVLFCGDVSGYFAGKSGPLVITYHTIAHRLFQGVACHDIVSVFEVRNTVTEQAKESK
jgi:hypothetical protein